MHTNDGEHGCAYLSNLDVRRVGPLLKVQRGAVLVPYLQSSKVPLRGHPGQR